MTLETSGDRTIHVTIKTLDGHSDEFKFKLDTLISVVKTDAMTKFNIHPPPGVKYKLAEKKNGNFRVLDDNKTLGQENIENKEILWLGTEQQVG